MERILHTYTSEFEPNPFSGLFIVIEGLDGSGNSTQVERLGENYFFDSEGLSSRHIMVAEEPTYGPFGGPVNFAIRRRLTVDDRTLQLGFSTDRSDHLATGGLEKHLEEKGNVVLMARYMASTAAYGYAAGLDMDWLIAVQSKFPVPDVMIYLDVPPEVCMERIVERAVSKPLERYEKIDFLKKVKEGYFLFMEKLPGIMTIVNGIGRVSDVTGEIIKIVEENPKMA